MHSSQGLSVRHLYCWLIWLLFRWRLCPCWTNYNNRLFNPTGLSSEIVSDFCPFSEGEQETTLLRTRGQWRRGGGPQQHAARRQREHLVKSDCTDDCGGLKVVPVEGHKPLSTQKQSAKLNCLFRWCIQSVLKSPRCHICIYTRSDDAHESLMLKLWLR